VTERDPSRSSPFERLAPAVRRHLLTLMEPRLFHAGTTILAEGERIGGLWVVVEGRCEVVKGAAGGPGHVLAELSAGAVFGEMAFYSTAPHAASVCCLTDVRVLTLTDACYAEIERTAPETAYAVAREIVLVLSDRLRRMDEWTGSLLMHTAPERREEWAEFRAKLYNDWEF